MRAEAMKAQEAALVAEPYEELEQSVAIAGRGGRSRSVPPSMRMTSTASATDCSRLTPTSSFLLGTDLCSTGTALSTTFERMRLCCGAEDVVCLLGLVEREPVSREHRRVEPATLDQLQQLRRRRGVDEAGRDQHITDPELLEMQGRALAMHANVRDPPPGRISSAQSSNVSGTPTASIAVSAPSPPVSSITFATASSLPLLIATSARTRAPSRAVLRRDRSQ